MRESERAKREAATAAELESAASLAWGLCADASRVLLELQEDPQFRELARRHEGLLEALPASLAPMMHTRQADAVLTLMVARATMQPLLARVEVLGWMARAYPDALVTLLKVMSPSSGKERFATGSVGS